MMAKPRHDRQADDRRTRLTFSAWLVCGLLALASGSSSAATSRQIALALVVALLAFALAPPDVSRRDLSAIFWLPFFGYSVTLSVVAKKPDGNTGTYLANAAIGTVLLLVFTTVSGRGDDEDDVIPLCLTTLGGIHSAVVVVQAAMDAFVDGSRADTIGMLGYSNASALLVVCTIPFAHRVLPTNWFRTYWVLAALAIIATGSRLGLLLGASAIVLTLELWSRGRWLAVTLLTICIGVVVVASTEIPFVRPALWRLSLIQIAEAPLWGATDGLIPLDLGNASIPATKFSHNLPLDLTRKYGLVGLGLWLFGFVATLNRCSSKRFPYAFCFAAISISALVDFAVYFPSIAMLFAISAGALASQPQDDGEASAYRHIVGGK